IGTIINAMGGMEQARAAQQHLDSLCVEAGLGAVHLQAKGWSAIPTSRTGDPRDSAATQDNTVRQLGFESITNYQWCHFVPLKEYEQWGDEAVAKYDEFDRDFSVPYFPHVSVDWDNNPRFPGEARPAVSGVTPEKFRKFLRKAKAYLDEHPSQTPLVTINAWNEWSEGSYLEPDTEYGYGFLEAVKSIFGAE
ncbi:MAG: glycoside hydrolase family 99-like domain-containing protein, partial [Bacteroidales bacterium]|nr:glycoside hydrolase family 99-like domain-containing protein [Candidatus Colimorpha merdihippi]